MARFEHPAEARKVADTTVTWANSAAANTENTVALSSDTGGQSLLVIVRNPSTVTAITVQPQVSYDDGGTTRWAPVAASQSVPVNTTAGQALIFSVGPAAVLRRVSLKNATVLGAADTFTARVVVYQQ